MADSKWEHMLGEKSPFQWSTPAPLMDGRVPAPWRVAKKDLAQKWLERISGEPDLYLEHEEDQNGRVALWVGLRNNRDPVAHSARLEALAAQIEKMRLPVEQVYSNGRVVGLIMSDDISKRSASASLRSQVIKLAHSQPELRPVLVPLLKRTAGDVVDINHALALRVWKSLQAGDEVEITYNDPQRGGTTSKIRTVSQGADETGGRYVYLEPTAQGMRTPGPKNTKAGMIQDQGDHLIWQPTMMTQVTRVISLRKVS